MSNLDGTIGAFKSSFAMLDTIFPDSFKLITVDRLIGSLTMEQIVYKAAFINVSGAELEYTDSMLEATTPIALILSTR